MSAPVTDVEEQDTLPALFEHCQRVYDKMETEANLIDLEPSAPSGHKSLIWEGYLTKLFSSLHLSVPYYTSVTRELKRMGCVRQKRRGGGNAPSQWEIITAPTEELFRSDMNRTSGIAAKKASRQQMLEQRVSDLSKTVNRIASENEAILDILMEREGKA